MIDDGEILVGAGETLQTLALRFSNRHGLIAGATGTGKTVTLQILAEGFSAKGVPVFLADVKGDLSGLSQAGVANPKLLERVARIGMADFAPAARAQKMRLVRATSGAPRPLRRRLALTKVSPPKTFQWH